jgi:hypothetical protein
VLIDPLIDFFGRANINKAPEVKALLLPLHNLAKKLNIAVVCVIHCNKADVKALYKGSGSIQFAGKARSVFLVEKSPEDEDEKVICHVKSNLGKITESLVYRIGNPPGQTGKPILIWDQQKTGKWTAEDLLGSAAPARPREIAEAFIRGRLTAGPCPSLELEGLLSDMRVSEATLNRAKAFLGVEARQVVDIKGRNYWEVYLPGYDPPTKVDTLTPWDQILPGMVEKIVEKVLSHKGISVNKVDIQGSDTLGSAERQDINPLENPTTASNDPLTTPSTKALNDSENSGSASAEPLKDQSKPSPSDPQKLTLDDLNNISIDPEAVEKVLRDMEREKCRVRWEKRRTKKRMRKNCPNDKALKRGTASQ